MSQATADRDLAAADRELAAELVAAAQARRDRVAEAEAAAQAEDGELAGEAPGPGTGLTTVGRPPRDADARIRAGLPGLGTPATRPLDELGGTWPEGTGMVRL